MKVEIKQNGKHWDLWVNGRLQIEGEALVIVEQVAWVLSHPDADDRVLGSFAGEAREVADVIRKAEELRAKI